ncbi:DNA-directed DNA polymerase [Spirochaetia bacterium]|nr:DNA-directed DNA polymerase [Spirochaetia bacterium]
MTDFVHLHVHSDYSLLDGAASVEELASRAASLGMKHLAITDHGNMFGALKFAEACRGSSDHPLPKDREAVNPIIGSEFYMAPGQRSEKAGSEQKNKYYHLVLLSTCEQGYRNLMKLSSYSYTEGFYYKPRIDRELLEKYHEGLICLSACVAGEIPSLILENRIEEAEKTAMYFRDLFGKDNFYLEIQDHGLSIQHQSNPEIINISKRTGIPLVLTNDIHYLEKRDSVAQDILLCISTGKKRSEEKRLRFDSNEFYFKTGDEMAALFPEYPEAIANTVKIAERCRTEIPEVKTKDLPKYLPDFDIPPGFADADAYIRHLTMEGLAKRYPNEAVAVSPSGSPDTSAAEKSHTEISAKWDEIIARAEYELDIIIKMGFTGYFLIVADFINWAKAHDIPVGPGRGSGAGSIVAYSLRITDLDPLRYNLLFERFLNPERISMPDFDVDFCNERRGEVIDYVTQKYGQNRVAQILTFGTLKAKAVIKDVARALDISLDESNMIAKLIPEDPKMNLKKAFAQEPRLAELEQDPRYTELFAIARRLEGKNRHNSFHAAGIVIGKADLSNYVPLFRDSKTGSVASQYTMDVIEPQGLVKMDFLGLKTLDLIKNTEDVIRSRGGEFSTFSVENIPFDDPAVYKMLGEGKSFGVFQFESSGMQNILKQARPANIEDLIALNSLYRPGPMDHIPQFIESKAGRQPIVYPDPSLEGILKETYGVIVYQEQVIQVARIIAGYSLGQADLLRRAMGKKKMEVMVKEKAKFIEGAVKRGYTEAKADEIFEILIPFAGYGFNKSHAAAYSVLAYQTAYLKANFPAEFMAANMTNEISSSDKLPMYMEEARSMGIAIDPPDINRSQKYFTVVDGRIVYGFLGIKGIGSGPASEIIHRREEGGPYRDFMDFLERVNLKGSGDPEEHNFVTKRVIEPLIKTGAFDSCYADSPPEKNVTRATLLANMEKAIDYSQSQKNEKRYGQGSLFDDAETAATSSFVFEKTKDWSREERLGIEKELIGFYFSGHPMDEYREIWHRAVKIDLGRPDTIDPGSYILIGLVKTVKPHTTGKGGRMAFGTLGDFNGDIEMTFFPGVWEKYETEITEGRIVALRGKIENQKDNGRFGFLVESSIQMNALEGILEQEEAMTKQMDEYRSVWRHEVKLNLSALGEPSDKEEYTLVGILKSLRPFQTQKGNSMASATLTDYNGEIGLTIFPKVWADLNEKLQDGAITVLKGKVKFDEFKKRYMFFVDSMPNLSRLKSKCDREQWPDAPAENAEEISSSIASASSWKELHIRLRALTEEHEEKLFPLRDYLVDHPGSCSVFIHVPLGGSVEAASEKVIRTANQISANADEVCIDGLTAYPEVAEVWRA